MNAETAIAGRAVAKLSAGAPIAGIVPSTIEDTFRLAELIHQSGLAPEQLKNPQAVTVVLLKGLEVEIEEERSRYRALAADTIGELVTKQTKAQVVKGLMRKIQENDEG